MIGLCVIFLSIQTLQLTNGGSSKKNYQDPNPIKYPGPVQEVNNRYGTIDSDDVPDECKDKRYCTVKPADYPQEEFNNLFKGYKVAPQPNLVIDDIPNRQADDSEDGCESIVTYEPLYKVRNVAGDWRTVVQAPDENFVQRVRLEECKEPKATCFTVFPSDPGVEVFCKQKYNLWEVLVAPTGGDTEPVKIKTELPVCCSCAYRLL